MLQEHSNFNFENIFQSTFMLAFFTTVGLGASFALLKKGGKLLIIYWLVCGIISIFSKYNRDNYY